MFFTVTAWKSGWRTWFEFNANALAWIALVVVACCSRCCSWTDDLRRDLLTR